MSELPATPIRRPRRLRAGDTVTIVAPATPWENRSELLRAVAALEGWGLVVRLGEHLDDRHGYLAGRDADRAADINAAYRDPEVKAIFCLQGGYGSARLVPHLDRDAISAHPKPLCGYSDITVLHLAIQAWSDPPTISFYSNGPSGLGAARVTSLSRSTMQRALFSDEPYGEIPHDPDDPYVRVITPGVAKGRLTGGCLELVRQTLGTPIEIDTTDRILYLEDVDIHTYTLDGQLTQLRNAGKLESCAGIVIGELKGAEWRDDHAAFMQELSVEDVLEDLIAPLGIPCIYGLPIGHGKHHATVPNGAMAMLDADAGRLVVEEIVTSE
jgi:muramoyltetrapeptide carboxypeptidase